MFMKRFLPTLLLLVGLAAPQLQAHAPGLSTGSAHAEGDSLTVTLRFAVESLPDGVGQAFFVDGIAIRQSAASLRPVRVRVTPVGDELIVVLRYALADTTRVTIDLNLLEKLSHGHRMYFTARSAPGDERELMLDALRSTVALDVRVAGTNREAN